MKILYEDKDIIVIDKPVGILSQSDGKGSENCEDILNACMADKGEKGKVHLIHRLDRNVGGVMVFAKNKAAAASLSAQIQNKTFIKEYVALVHSAPEETQGVFEDLLFKDSRKNKTFVVNRMRKGVKDAKLSYKVLETCDSKYGQVSLVHIRLYTGRTHQIRVQFASRKMPLVGDGKYGGSDNGADIGLRSYRLTFIHPSEKKEVIFRTEGELTFPE